MAKENKTTYWPYFILGFLLIGLTLGYWTIRSASNMPVQEVNQYMLKYQMTDMTINDIIRKKAAFDIGYMISLQDKERIVMSDNVNSRFPLANAVKLSKGNNVFSFVVESKAGEAVTNAKVAFLLTQPHSRTQDQLFEDVPFSEGKYTVKDVEIQKPGRYVLQFRAQINEDTIGYYESPAYLEP